MWIKLLQSRLEMKKAWIICSQSHAGIIIFVLLRFGQNTLFSARSSNDQKQTQLSTPKTPWFVGIEMETAGLHPLMEVRWFELLFVCVTCSRCLFLHPHFIVKPLNSKIVCAISKVLWETVWTLTCTLAGFLQLIGCADRKFFIFLHTSVQKKEKRGKKKQKKHTGYCHESSSPPW